LKDVAAASSSSIDRESQGQDPMMLEEEQDGGLLDQISVANPD